MRSGKVAWLLLWLVLLGLTSGCCITSPPLGGILVDIDARETARCDDGIKVVVEGIQEDWEFGEIILGSNIRDSGSNWAWVEPGRWGTIQWDVSSLSPAVKHPQGKQVTIKAYCMRKNAEPGLSQLILNLEDYIVIRSCHNVLELSKVIADCGGDPDYTVTPPGLHIEDEVVMNNLCNGQ